MKKYIESIEDTKSENKDFIKKSFDELDQDTLPRVGCFYDPNYSR